ncbi:hypothetical protein SAMN04487905_1283 [Actinopolyspora xinjiangensis]|uniref:Uncharacterized protein n=1 Tax=Actinopolyspora xinjiangensis TaxID=405564 RepID=A0A1H0X3E2_9ACTN|nr:hypothetical protein [Actinopolyspora xinjiangensis]SDP97432.1 hypothetical protein SAMN04487905_1283 [Actinopolyspora xinjiangensis]
MVNEGFDKKWSQDPTQHPDDSSMRVSHETIYQALFLQARGPLRTELKPALRSGRTPREPIVDGGNTLQDPRYGHD